ncbi:insulin gene enhancer protein isl-1 [Elysia marginata]|uniref:Insulin gene enhancer protein isl-1 n=1 Tax=Elysia marginata TaxID=1093978 RepID=A0AAV4G2C6_9GAST|nr:insulin gene enhancer protein isl-1 [Elysia marginata]
MSLSLSVLPGRSDKSSRGGGGHKSDHKTTRVRTVLNEKQLHTLRTCYNANPRPDALMKEQLTEMTGLSPRVIRVWFQNKRCKDKKRSILMKQMQQQQEKVVVFTYFDQRKTKAHSCHWSVNQNPLLVWTLMVEIFILKATEVVNDKAIPLNVSPSSYN